MSQPPNRQSSPPPEPERNPQDSQATQVTSNFGQPIKAQSIKVLRGTITLLENLVAKLEAEPSVPTTPSFWDKLPRGWSRLLAQIRNLLPALARISDTGLTSIIAAIAVVLVGTIIFLNQQAPEVANVPVVVQPPVAEAPPSEELPVVEPTPEIIAPPEEPFVEEPPPPEVLAEPSASIAVEEPATSEQPTDSNTEAIAPVEEPSTPTVELAPAEETPAPTVELTPEQTLIAAIEKQVAQINTREGDGIVQAIQANFPASSLTVIVTTDWYNLNSSQQDKLAAQILQRAQDLDFIHLEVVDPQKKLIARSPVVGNNMVILKRQAP